MPAERGLQCAGRLVRNSPAWRGRSPTVPQEYIRSIYTERASATTWNYLLRAGDTRQSKHTPRLFRRPSTVSERSIRSFASTACVQKKGGKAARDEQKASGQEGASEDPNDLTALEFDIATSIERLRDDLSKLRAGGRFNSEVLENLRVQPDKNNKQTVKLSDLAQVIPKGRTLQILVGEKDYLKPITSAIQSSNLSFTPQPDPTGANPLLLLVNIPHPTTDSRRAVVNEATKAGEKASTSIKDSRGKQQKKLRSMQSSKSARPDDLKKASDKMEKTVERGQAEVKKIVDNAKKVLEGG